MNNMIKIAYSLLFEEHPSLDKGAKQTQPVSTYPVEGHCMEPFIPDGAIVYVSPIIRDQVRVGDVVGHVNAKKGLVAHRVIQIENGNEMCRWITRGDNGSNTESIEPNQAFFRIKRVETSLGAYDTDSVVGALVSTIMCMNGFKGDILRRTVTKFGGAAYRILANVL